MDTLNDLHDFINRAQNNRKYLPNVATNFRTPLRLIEKELSEEEKASIDLLKKNLEQIVNVIYSRSNNALSAASLGIYKRRIMQLISDYENYGKDPDKMASWDRKITSKKHKERKTEENASIIESPINSSSSFENSELQVADLNLTNGKARIIVPNELTEKDTKRLIFQIELLAGILPDEKK